MMKKNAIILFLLMLIGCSARIGDFSVISTKNIDMDGEYELVGRDVKGTDMRPIILYIPTGTPTIENAIDDALESVGGDIMTDVIITSNVWWLYLYGEQKYIVVGDVWKEVK
mgnify:CR=1 FL=1|tara:strand:+ start:307 stop:642 length:336 start_codon:yes stop_codon:yes gene_type:complete